MRSKFITGTGYIDRCIKTYNTAHMVVNPVDTAGTGYRYSNTIFQYNIILYTGTNRRLLRGSDDPNGIFDFFTKKRSVLLNFYVFYVIMLL